MKKKPARVGSLIPNLLKSIESSFPTGGHRVWEVWDEVVGPEIAKRAQPLELRGANLTLGVSSSPWLQQLTFLAPDIIESLNKKLGKKVVGKIRCRLATIEPPPKPVRPEPDLDSVTLTSAERELVESTASGVADSEIAAAIKKARTANLKRQQLLHDQEAPLPHPSTSSDHSPRDEE